MQIASLARQCISQQPNHTTIASRKYTNPPFLLKVIAKGHSLLESTPTQQTKIICSSMLVMKSEVYMYVWASTWSGRNQNAVQSDHGRL